MRRIKLIAGLLLAGAALGDGVFFGPSSSDILNEDFDASPGFSSAGWTTNGIANPDYTPAIVGVHSLNIPIGTTNTAVYSIPTTKDSITVSAMLICNGDVGGSTKIIQLRDNLGIQVGALTRNASGAIRAEHDTATTAATAGYLTRDGTTTNYLWIKWIKGTGTDGVCQVGFSQDGVRPSTGTNYAAVATGAAVNQVKTVVFQTDGTVAQTFDQVRIWVE